MQMHSFWLKLRSQGSCYIFRKIESAFKCLEQNIWCFILQYSSRSSANMKRFQVEIFCFVSDLALNMYYSYHLHDNSSCVVYYHHIMLSGPWPFVFTNNVTGQFQKESSQANWEPSAVHHTDCSPMTKGLTDRVGRVGHKGSAIKNVCTGSWPWPINGKYTIGHSP